MLAKQTRKKSWLKSAREIVAKIKISSGKRVRALVFDPSTAIPVLFIHMKPLTEGEATPTMMWQGMAVAQINLNLEQRNQATTPIAIAIAARRRWKSVRFYINDWMFLRNPSFFGNMLVEVSEKKIDEF